MNKISGKPRTALAAVLLLFVFAGVLIFRSSNSGFQKTATIQSPDGRFEIIVYRKLSKFAMMPGQASDASGLVRLCDRRGNLLHEAPIDMVQRTNDIEWHEDRVELPLVFEWKLPK